MNGILNVNNANFTNNLKDIVIRNGNAGDLIVGVVVTSGETLIKDSYFANNTGSWGGAISSLGYMNDEAYTLTVTGTTFEGNNATFGGAIFVESSRLVVDDCTFNENSGVGVGSSGTSNTQGGAIVVFPDGAKATITNSIFTKNSANTGGAVSLAGVDQDSLIEGCTFTENTANDGGAVYLWTGGDAAVTVKDSTFTGNTAGWGNAISTDGALKLEGNTISTTSADIGNWAGSIESKVYAVILANDTYNWHMAGFVINATLTDDNGNLINDHKFNFVISKEGAEDITLPATYYSSLGYYQGTFTPTETGEYLINLDYAVEEVQTSVIKVSKSLIDLKNIIDNDEDGIIDLDGDYAYIAEFDSVIVTGIPINKEVTINGNNHVINGSDLARLFKVESAGTLKLNDVTIANGKANPGAGVYSEGVLIANRTTFINNNAGANDGEAGAIAAWGPSTIIDNSVFTNNVAWLGGAIESYSSTDGTTILVNNSKFNGNSALQGAGIFNQNVDITVDNSAFDNNNVTGTYSNFAWASGAHIWSDGKSTTTLMNSNFTNGYTEYNGGAVYMQPAGGYNAVIDGCRFEDNVAGANYGAVYFAAGGTTRLTVTGSKFINNKGADKAGAIYFSGTTLTVTGTEFKENSAGKGGAIDFRGYTLNVDDSTFTDNTATNGGAIYIDGTGLVASSIKATISNSKFTGNDPENGGALYLGAGTTTVKENCEFNENTADFGGAIYAAEDTVLNVENSKFTKNSAVNKGGAIYTLGKLTVTGSEFDQNDITYRTDGDLENGGAAIYAGTGSDLIVTGSAFTNNLLNYNMGTDKVLGAVAVMETATITDSTFTNNAGRWGGAISATGYVDTSTDGKLTISNVVFTKNNANQGGAVFAQLSDLVIENSKFIENTAYDGGAILHDSATPMDGVANKYTATISNTLFDGNIATHYGSAIEALSAFTYTKSNFTNNKANGGTGTIHYFGTTADTILDDDSVIDGCRFEGNTASYYDVYFYGTKSLDINDSIFKGANVGYSTVLFYGDKLTVSETSFEDNTAGRYGGAIYVAKATTVDISESDFTRNSAGIYGGAVLINSATAATISDCDFIGNSAPTYGGAVFTSAPTTITGSLFQDNTGNAKVFNIYHGSTLTLTDNTFKTLKADNVTIDVEKDTYAYGESIPVTGTFDWGVNNYAIALPVDLTKEGTTETKNQENFKAGDIAFALEDLTPGYYTVEIKTFTDAEGNQYIVETASDSFTIEKATPTITVVAEDTDRDALPAKVTVTVTDVNDDPIEGLELVVIVNGEEYPITTNADGQYVVEVSDLELKNYTAVAFFAGDDVYTSAYGTDDFRVTAVPEVIVTINDVSYGEENGIEVILVDGDTKLDGVVEVTISGFEDPFVVAVADGYGFLELNPEDFDADTYTYTAIARENGNYVQTEPTEEQEFTVSLITVTIDFPIPWVELGKDGFGWLNIFAGEIDAEDDLDGEQISTIATLIFKDAEGNELFTMEDVQSSTSYDTAVEFEFADYPIGTYYVTVVLDDNYNVYGKDTFDFLVTKQFYDLNVEGDETIRDGDTETHTITLGTYEEVDEDEWEFVQSDYAGTAIVTVYNFDDEVVETIRVPIEDGEGVISFGAGIGEYYYIIDLDDETYALTENEHNLNVLPKLGTYTDLQYQIDNAENFVVDLSYDFAFDEEYDLANNPDFVNGVVIREDITINAYGNTISGSDKARIFYVESNTMLVLNEAILSDGKADNGGAIYLESNANLDMYDCYVHDNTAAYNGGAIYGLGYMFLVDTVFENDEVTDAGQDYGGGAIFAGENSNLQVYRGEFDNNAVNSVWSNGGAIHANGAAFIYIDDSDFNGNFGTMGGAICIENADLDALIENSRFSDNHGIQGGAIFINRDVSGDIAIAGSTFDSNYVSGRFTESATAFGGAIWVGSNADLSISISDSAINNNYNEDGTLAGAIYIAKNTGLTMENVELAGNKAYMAIILLDGDNEASFTNVRFINNEVTFGTILTGANAQLIISESEFRDNSGNANYYNIYNAGGTVTIENTGFYTITPTVAMDNEFDYGDDVTFNGTFYWGYVAALDMQYSINGQDASTTVTGGRFSEDLGNDFAVGTYTVVIKSFTDADGNYYAVNDVVFTFTVAKATPVLEVEGDDYLMPGATATVGITLADADGEGIEGIVIVTVDGKDYVVYTDEDGEGELEIEGLANNRYPITAKFIGNDNYATVTNDTEFIDFYYRDAVFDIVIEDVTYGDVINIIVENATDLEGNPLSGIVYGNIENAEGNGAGLVVWVEEGSGTATVRKLDAGDYNVVATFADDDYEYTSETKEFTFNVAKAESALDVTYADGEFTIALDGVNGEKLNESVDVLIDGVAYDAQVTENGTVIFTIADLTVGRHTIEVAFAGNDNYLGDIDSYTFEIPKATPVLEVEGDDYLMPGATATVGITLADADGEGIEGIVIVTVDGKDYVVYTDEDGEGELEIEGLVAKEYPIVAKFIGNDDYEAAVNDTETIDFYMYHANFDIVIEDITYGEGLVVVVENVTDDEGNELSGIVMGNIENAAGAGAGLAVQITDGAATETIDGLAAGTYEVVATFYDEDYEYISETIRFNITVSKAESALDVTYADGEFTIALDGVNGEKLNESVDVLIDGVAYDAQVTENGTVIFTIADLTVGRHTIEVAFAGNDNYLDDIDSYTFTVPKATPVVSVVGDEIDVGESAVVAVTVMDGETGVAGYAVVTVNGVDYSVEIDEDGTGTLTIAGLPYGEYPIVAKFLGNDDYEAADYAGDAKVAVDSDEVTFDVAVDGDNTEITVSNAKDAAGDAIDGYIMGELFKDGAKVQDLTMDYVEDGEGTIAIPDGLSAGTYTAMITVMDEDGNMAVETVTFTVPNATPTIDVTGDEINSGETATVTVTVMDGETGVAGIAVVTVNDVDYAVNIGEDGTGTLTIERLAVDSYDIAAKFIANDYYESAEYVGDAKVVVNPSAEITIDVIPEELVYGEDAIINVTVTDGDGIDIPVEKVNVTVNGETQEYPVEDGQVNLGQLPVGETSITVSYVDETHEPASADITLNVAKAGMTFNANTSPVVYRDDLIVEITDAATADNDPVSGTVIVYYLDNEGQERSATGDVVDGNGQVKLTDLDAGVYDLVIVFNNDSYEADAIEMNGIVLKADPELTVNIDSVELGEKIAVEIELRGYHDEAINETVNLTVNGEFIGEYTTVNGRVSFEIDNDLDVSEYVAIAEFEGNDNYNSAVGTALFNVTKATPVVTVEGAEVEWGEEATIKVTVTDKEGKALNGTAVVRVSWDVDFADEYIDVVDGAGEATFEISPYVAPGEYDITVFFLGDENYADVNNTDAVLVLTEPKAVELEVSADAGAYGEASNVTVTLKDASGEALEDATVTVYVDGNEYANATVGEDGTVMVPVEGLSAGDHNVTVKFDDGVHVPASEEITVTVDAASDAIVSFTGETVQYGNDYPIAITVEDAEGNSLSGDVTVVVDGNEYAKEAIDGNLVVDIADLEAGDYYVEVIFENPDYAEAGYGALITVDKAAANVKAENAETEWGKEATIKVTVTDKDGNAINGTAIVRVESVDQYIDIEDGVGEAVFEISGIVAPGEYDVTVLFLGGRNYADVNASAKLTLTAPKDVTLDVAVEAGDYGEATAVIIDLKDKSGEPLNGSVVTVYVDGKEYANATVGEDGTVTVPVEGLDAGDHNITVKFDDGVHAPAEKEVTATVDPVAGADLEATVTPAAAGENSTVDIAAKDSEGNPLSGNAVIVVDGKPYATVPLDENGTASVPIEGLDVGDHVVEVKYDNPNYLPATYTTQFSVKAQESDLKVTVDKESIVYGDGDITATMSLTADGKAIDGVVSVALNGELQNVTVTGGKATVTFNDLAAGNYTVVADYAGTSAAALASDSATFNVARKATYFNYEDMNTTAVNPNIDGRIGEYFYFQLVDIDGKPLADKNVSIGFNGKIYNRTTNETGWAKLQINLAKIFRYTFAISFLGDENYTAAFNVALINVSTQTPKLTTSAKTYKASAKTKSLTATFKTSSGNAVSGRKITFTVNGKTYSAKTNSKGVATVNVSLTKKGTYSFTAKFAGDDTYAAISKSAKLTIK